MACTETVVEKETLSALSAAWVTARVQFDVSHPAFPLSHCVLPVAIPCRCLASHPVPASLFYEVACRIPAGDPRTVHRGTAKARMRSKYMPRACARETRGI